jgi:hypothetical protein
MEFKSYDDLLKLQQRFSESLAEQLQLVKAARPPDGDAAMADKQAMLEASKSAIQSLRRAKEESVRRLDAEIARHTRTADELEQDIKAFEKARREAGGAEKKAARKAGAKTARRA